MRSVLFFIILITSIAFVSCKKEAALKFEDLSKISFSNKLLDEAPLKVKIDGKLFEDKGLPSLNSQATFLLNSGNHSFAFYDASGKAVLDTSLAVTGTLQQFDLFRPDTATRVVFLNEHTLGLDTEPAPKPGHFKIKLANFTPDTIDVIFSANDQFFMKIPVDTIFNVKKNLDDFVEIALPTEVSGGAATGYIFDIYDRTYQMNLGDYGINVENQLNLQQGKLYVAYLIGGTAFGTFTLKQLYTK